MVRRLQCATPMRTRLAVALLAGALHLLGGGEAEAGCPNLCTLSVSSPDVVPPLDCLVVSATGDDCNCGLRVDFENKCAGGVDALGFLFRNCSHLDSSRVHECSSLPAGKGAVLHLELPRATGTGPKEKQLVLRAPDGRERTVQIGFTIRSFDENDGPLGCSASPAAPATVAVAPMVALAAAVLGLLRGRRRQ